MAHKGKKVFIALSGGVDSSTSAALLLEAGYNCAGVFMITNENSSHAQTDAEEMAEKLGIKLYVLDLRKDFERILDYFCNEYKRGRTPNPCVLCNRLMKFGKLWAFAQSKGAELLATGHYARIIESNGKFGLYEAVYTFKDQSYALSMIDNKILPYIILPMGCNSKDQTRKIASKFGLGTAQKEESQEICFVPDNDYASVLKKCFPELVHSGNIINSSGNVLGEHDGIYRFTIGQRRGLRIAMGKPYYVVNINADSNTVTLGPKEELFHKQLYATDVNWLIDKPVSVFRARVKVRYNDKGNSAQVYPQGDSVTVEFDEPKSAITPGQLAVFYIQEGKNNEVAGAGWIDKAFN
ncbi:MAG: tRNA 2-thiouridine(34) synthase MnmA [Planctomycetes bacterium RBG_13_46_10]|nr:MAG: tRNA 2-thiouridine(34) synthase MnmA [Planctomycetes bacterium RBG_13_46_10]